MKLQNRKLIIFIPTVLACLIDLILTALHQNPQYWLNTLSKVNEMNPILRWAMTHHFLGLFIVTFIWLILLTFVILILPVRIGRIISLALVLGNTWGASSWISHYYGFWYLIPLYIFNSTLFIICYELQQSNFDRKENR